MAGPGDYTNYTEDDIREIARVLTGWRDVGFFSTNPGISVGAIFRPFQHDSGQKQLSHRFNNILLEDMGDQEYAHLIDVIFQQDEAARFICRKLYRWFVYYVIDDNAEENVIAPMAQLLVDNDYEIQPALEALLGSAHFFDMLNVGPMIKNPLDFVMSSIKPFGVEFPQPLRPRYNGFLALFNSTVLQQMEYYNPPQVAGWKAYYQEPQYYRTWINATTLPIRMLVTDTMALNGFPAGDFRVRIDPLAFVETIDNPNDPNALIEEFVQILFPQPITDDQKAALKEVLIPGLPDFEWTVEYNLYLATPDDEELAEALNVNTGSKLTRVRRVIRAANRPVAFLVDILPEEVLQTSDLPSDFNGSVLDFLLARGDSLTSSRANVSAIGASADVAKPLEIQRGDVLLHFYAQLFNADGKVVDYSLSYFIPGYFHFHVVRRVGGG